MNEITLSDAMNLSAIINMVGNGGKRVARVANGVVLYGTARHFVSGPDSYVFAHNSMDIRDAYLRVTAQGGFEHAWQVRQLMDEYSKGTFLEYDWS